MKATDFLRDVLPLKDKLFRLAWRITLDRQEAEDITQDTLLRVWQARHQWPEIDSIQAYSLTICRRLAIDTTKAKRSQNLSLSETAAAADALHATAPLPDDELDSRQRVTAIRRIIDQLPEAQRTVVQLRDIEAYSYDEIAHITGLSETQVRVYLHRARAKLREAAKTWNTE